MTAMPPTPTPKRPRRTTPPRLVACLAGRVVMADYPPDTPPVLGEIQPRHHAAAIPPFVTLLLTDHYAPALGVFERDCAFHLMLPDDGGAWATARRLTFAELMALAKPPSGGAPAGPPDETADAEPGDAADVPHDATAPH